jgi:cation:H+ antiporter
VGESAAALVELTGLSPSAVGTVFAAVANSLPMLVTAIAAVCIGAVNLGVGDIIGGIGFESALVLLRYAGSVVLLFT